ncbi:MAG: hypothetical protein AB7I32_05635 [Gammaproteobacteria bacterium]
MQKSSSSLVRAVESLRGDADVHATDPGTQQRYEAWARRDGWQLRREALPLVVGHDPSTWAAQLEATGREALADELVRALARDLGVDTEASVAPLAVRRWAQSHGLRLPQALSRLLGFVSSVLPQASADDAAVAEVEVLRAQERETLLGAALMLVTKEQAACLDENGGYSPAKIAQLIRSRALLWFPLAPPSLDEAEIAALIARWIKAPHLP